MVFCCGTTDEVYDPETVASTTATGKETVSKVDPPPEHDNSYNRRRVSGKFQKVRCDRMIECPDGIILIYCVLLPQ